MRTAPGCLITLLLLAGCNPDKPEATRETGDAVRAAAPATAVPSPAPEALPEQLAAMAFRAAWRSAPPAQLSRTRNGYEAVQTFRSGRLIPVQRDVYAFLSEGHGGDSHADTGSLAIHYLKRTPQGFERLGAWPDLVAGGTWGVPPEWTVRADLMPGPTIVTTGGGTWQGYSCQWADVVELTPTRPIARASGLHLSYSSGGALGDAGEAYEGRILPGRKGQTFRVDYDTPDVTVTYAKVDDSYDPVGPPELPWC